MKAQADALTKRLENISKKTVILTEKVDCRVLGGLKVELDGQEFDGTVKKRFDNIRDRIDDITIERM